MRGYLSFLLVLAALSILIVLSNSYNNSKSTNFSKAIALERAEQLSMGIKRNMLTAAKYGAIAGFLEYCVEVAESGGLKALDPAEAKERVKFGSHSSLALAGFSPDEDFQVLMWCGQVESEGSLDLLAEQSLRAGMPLLCPGCQPIQSPMCKDFIEAEVSADGGSASITGLTLGSRNLGGNDGEPV